MYRGYVVFERGITNMMTDGRRRTYSTAIVIQKRQQDHNAVFASGIYQPRKPMGVVPNPSNRSRRRCTASQPWLSKKVAEGVRLGQREPSRRGVS